MHEDLAQIEAELFLALKGLDNNQTQISSGVGKWSIQQTLEHLVLSYQQTIRVLAERLEKGRPTQAKATFSQLLGQLLVIRLGSFPAGRKAPVAVTPDPQSTFLGVEGISRRVHESLAEMNQAADAAEEWFGEKRCASHIVLGPLAIAQWRRFHLVHARHHFKQIRRIRQLHGV